MYSNGITSFQVVDTRPKGRFDGTAPEPNPKIRSGHMLGTTNFPFLNIIDSQNKTMKNPEELKKGTHVHTECWYMQL